MGTVLLSNAVMCLKGQGNSHQVLLSERSIPEIKVPIEKLLPKYKGDWGKENPSKRVRKGAFIQRKFGVTMFWNVAVHTVQF